MVNNLLLILKQHWLPNDSYLPAENRRQNGACTEIKTTTVLSVNIDNDVLLRGKISKKS